MDEFPPEICWQISSFLTIPEALISLRICTSFFALSDRDVFWKELFDQYPPFSSFPKPEGKRWKEHCVLTWKEVTLSRSSLKDFDKIFLMKMLLVGDKGAGKSCLLLRYSDDFWTDSYIPTIGVDFKIVTVGEKELLKRPIKPIKLQIWDIMGDESFTAPQEWYRGCHAIVICCDLTKLDSLEQTRRWFRKFHNPFGSAEDTPGNNMSRFVLVGTKCDLKDRRVISSETLQKLGDELGIKVFETSSKDNFNVTELFLYLARSLYSSFEFHNIFFRKWKELEEKRKKELKNADESWQCTIL